MTKRRIVIKVLIEHGMWQQASSGSADHDKMTNGVISIAVPRHSEISNQLAQRIYKEAGVPRKDWRL